MPNTTKEVWKDVVGFEGQYQISSLGRLKHFTKRFVWKLKKEVMV